jgi:sec-independent protein translocase protein TatA
MLEGLFQPMHLLLILGIALLFFGPKRLPELGKGLGASIRDFKDAMTGPRQDETASSQLEAPKAAVGVSPANQAAPAAPQPPQPPQPPAQASQTAPPTPPNGPGGNSPA